MIKAENKNEKDIQKQIPLNLHYKSDSITFSINDIELINS